MKRAPLLILAFLCCTAASAQTQSHLTPGELQNLRLPDVTLDKVEPVPADAQKKAAKHLRVLGTIGGSIRFELLLPDAWNNRFVMGGGGGFVGSIQNAARDAVNRGYATVGTDTGHTSVGVTATWAHDNPEAKINFGFLAVHRTAEVAKAITRAYYNADPSHAYFVGCSRGGGQAMMESQRYPNDFDGIVAGAPAFNWTGFAAMSVSIAKSLYPDPAHLERTVLDRDALQKLKQSIIDQCDEQDGLKDGIVADPPSARFDVDKIPGITPDQRRAIAAIYAGIKIGDATVYPGYSPGAEVDVDQWIAWMTGPAPALIKQNGAPDLMFGFGTQIFKYFVFDDPSWNYATYDLSHYDRDTRQAATVLNATNPNLGAFKNRKGKLIIWHGWADPALPAQATVNYHREVLKHDPAASDYCRLFMIPGCLHCGGGPGPSETDWLATITDWVEHDKAPDQLVASKHEKGQLTLTRPLYPYPKYPVYKGSGDASKAESFEAKVAR